MKWEYKIIGLPRIRPVLPECANKEERHNGFGEWEVELDELGKEGWELICYNDNDQSCFFKRLIKNTKQK